MVYRDMKALRAMGVGCASARLKNGSTKKDLWYHLVSPWPIVPCEWLLTVARQADEAGLEKEKPPTRDVVADGELRLLVAELR